MSPRSDRVVMKSCPEVGTDCRIRVLIWASPDPLSGGSWTRHGAFGNGYGSVAVHHCELKVRDHRLTIMWRSRFASRRPSLDLCDFTEELTKVIIDGTLSLPPETGCLCKTVVLLFGLRHGARDEF